MLERTFETPSGTIVYWVSELLAEGSAASSGPTLIFLPGLTADHRLFDAQVAYFESRLPLMIWDAPGHAASRPFILDFDLAQKARWLHEILAAEGVAHPVIVGQSMGGYVGQMFTQLFPEELAGFVSIDSAPLQREYVSSWEIWLLARMAPVYKHYPRSWLLSQGSNGVSETAEGKAQMRSFIETYPQDEYAALAGHGYKMLADAMAADLPYAFTCPVQLICGEEDKAASTKRYNKAWAAKTGYPMAWIAGAGHNSCVDKPDEINAVIEEFANSLN
ncbi:MAG: alpha/beta hydrolase [Eggerthellaceae bacterium]|nr:alpha/beta hydrolase [Eggerthellaceae bacterium]